MRPRPAALYFFCCKSRGIGVEKRKHWSLFPPRMKKKWNVSVSFSRTKQSKTKFLQNVRIYSRSVCPRPEYYLPHKSFLPHKSPGSQDPKMPGSQDLKIPGTQGPRIPGSETEDPRTQDPRAPGSQIPRTVQKPRPTKPRARRPAALGSGRRARKKPENETWCFSLEKMVFFAFRWISWPATLDAATKKVPEKRSSAKHCAHLISVSRVVRMCKMSAEI